MKTYFRVETFALGSVGGGSWNQDHLFKGNTPEQAFGKALEFVTKQGFASQVNIVACEKDGENFQ